MKQILENNPHANIFNMEGDTHAQASIASLHNNTSSSSTIRFLGLLKQPDSDPGPFELHESDVLWSSDLSDSGSIHSQSPPTVSNSRHHPHHHHHHQFHHLQFHTQRSGLSAALTDDQHPLVRRKSTLNPSLSAASAARTIPPVPLPRSEGPPGLGKYHQSAPVNVPVWPKKIEGFGAGDLGYVDEGDEGAEEMVPPHVIVARSHVMTFSVLEGVGRTLKGRDLRRVRNAVFQKTGFID